MSISTALWKRSLTNAKTQHDGKKITTLRAFAELYRKGTYRGIGNIIGNIIKSGRLFQILSPSHNLFSYNNFFHIFTWCNFAKVVIHYCFDLKCRKVAAITSSETQGLLAGMMLYFWAKVYFKSWRAPGNLFLPNQFQKWSSSAPLIGQKNIFLPNQRWGPAG